MKFIQVCCDLETLGIDPRAFTNPVAGIDGGLAARGLGAEIGAPYLAACPMFCCQGLAMFVGTGKPTKISPIGSGRAGDKE
jgi:hypothetical protein